MGNASQYFWVVLCKNRRFHRQQNLFSPHRIPLAEADAISPPPPVNGAVRVCCDECGREHTYRAQDLLRAELDYPESFAPHPQFQERASVPESIPVAFKRRTVLARVLAAMSPYFPFRDNG